LFGAQQFEATRAVVRVIDHQMWASILKVQELRFGRFSQTLSTTFNTITITGGINFDFHLLLLHCAMFSKKRSDGYL
jgi:hypothetical protein